jgi:hypothetical protein
MFLKIRYKSWPKSNGSKYKGGWEKYYENMCEFKQETLLPKFFMFFSIEVSTITYKNNIFSSSI